MDELVVTDTIPLREDARACKKIRQPVGRRPARGNHSADLHRGIGEFAVHRIDFLTRRCLVADRRITEEHCDENRNQRAQARGAGTGASRRLRRSGSVPGIVYGGDEDAVNIELDHQALYPATSRNEKLPRLDPDARSSTARRTSRCCCARSTCIRTRRRCSTSTSSASPRTSKIHMKVPLHFVNAEKSPGVKEQGGVLNHVLNELNVTCLPGRPAGVHRGRPRATSRSATRSTCSDLTLPKGVEAVLHKSENPVGRDRRSSPALITEEEEAAAAAVLGGGSADHRAGRRLRRTAKRRAEGDKGRREGAATRPAAQGRGEAGRQSGRQEREEVKSGASASLSAWATRARSTSARATTPASGWWSALLAASGVTLRKDPKYQALVGAARAERRLAAAAAELHECERARGADAGRLLQDQAGRDPGGARRARLRARRRAHEAGRRHRRAQRPDATSPQRVGSHDYWRLRLGIGHPGDKNAVARLRAARSRPAEDTRRDRPGDRPRARRSCRNALRATCRGRCRSSHSRDEAGERKQSCAESRWQKEAAKKKQLQPRKSRNREKPAGLLKSLFGKK